ncbi:hypothetical protein BKA56DRAFT_63981 [Ilyonectria sp. MPI-CAGE-AT-0026]|nr:hypothetical protein BKA56DRAFT_63981 [Ilyonectria sp. MPI-CAGE-AT-0026]
MPQPHSLASWGLCLVAPGPARCVSLAAYPHAPATTNCKWANGRRGPCWSNWVPVERTPVSSGSSERRKASVDGCSNYAYPANSQLPALRVQGSIIVSIRRDLASAAAVD